MAVFEAVAKNHEGRPDGQELLELRFVSAKECAVSAAMRSPTIRAQNTADGFRFPDSH